MIVVLAAAVVGLVVAVTGTFVARSNLVEATSWVRHTSEVELALADCRLQLRDAGGLSGRRTPLAAAMRSAERVRQLTVDNPAQQVRVNALLDRLRGSGGQPDAGDAIDGMLRELAAVEVSLKEVRWATLVRATRIGWLMLAISAGLTVIMVVVFVTMLMRQSRALAVAQANFTQKSALLESTIESMVDGIMAITPERKALHFNQAALRLLGEEFPTSEFPKDWRALIECLYEDGTPMKPEEGALARAITGKSTDDLLYQVRRLRGAEQEPRWISATGRPVRDAEGTILAGVVVLRDVTEQKRHQDQLRALSISDELTGLHNRRGFLMLAEQQALISLRRRSSFAVVFADLNGLKKVNDSLGHEIGDQMIRDAAKVLRDVLRESDILARLGGDEFVALLADARTDMSGTIGERIERALARYNLTRGAAPVLSMSIGMSFFDPQSPVPISELMTEADRLMYENKRAHHRQGADTAG